MEIILLPCPPFLHLALTPTITIEAVFFFLLIWFQNKLSYHKNTLCFDGDSGLLYASYL